MESGETIICAFKESRLNLSLDQGMGLKVRTPFADLRIDRRGFLIASPKLTSRAGLQIRDRVLGVNDIPIDGLGSLFQTYQTIKQDSTNRTVTVTVERNEQPLTLTFRNH